MQKRAWRHRQQRPAVHPPASASVTTQPCAAPALLPSDCLPQGLRILEYACDHAAEHTDSPLRLWGLLEKEVKVGGRRSRSTVLVLVRQGSK